MDCVVGDVVGDGYTPTRLDHGPGHQRAKQKKAKRRNLQSQLAGWLPLENLEKFEKYWRSHRSEIPANRSPAVTLSSLYSIIKHIALRAGRVCQCVAGDRWQRTLYNNVRSTYESMQPRLSRLLLEDPQECGRRLFSR